MNSVAILYICTGRYVEFWKGFYQSCEDHLLPGVEKFYFVFTDSEQIFGENQNVRIHRSFQVNPGWPDSSLLRFHMFLNQETEIQKHAFTYFFNANMQILSTITPDEFLPGTENLVVALHPLMTGKKNVEYPYERRRKSRAYIERGAGRIYVQGSLIGGKTAAFLEMCKTLSRNIDDDRTRRITAAWHDESHLNWYVLGRKDLKVLSPSYNYPEQYELPWERKILMLDKSKYFNVARLKNPIRHLLTKILPRPANGSTVSRGFRALKRIILQGFAPIGDIFFLHSNRLTFVPEEGLANRIKHIFSYLKSRGSKVRLLNLHWQMGSLVTEHFYNLFELKGVEVNEINHSMQIDRQVELHNTWRLLVPRGLLPKGFTLAYPKDRNNEEYIDLEFDRIPQNVRELYRPLFASLGPSPLVKKRMNEVTLPTENCVGVHIRINNQWRAHNRAGSGDLEKFVFEMSKWGADTTFFLASCDEDVSNYIRSRFPERVVELPQKDLDSNIDAAAELFLLTVPGHLIVSYGSSFNEVAWWLGGCRQSVTVVGSYEEWRRAKAR